MALRVTSPQGLFDMDSSKDDGGELGRLMHDFRAKEAKEMQAGALADRVHELKETEKGVEHMLSLIHIWIRSQSVSPAEKIPC